MIHEVKDKNINSTKKKVWKPISQVSMHSLKIYIYFLPKNHQTGASTSDNTTLSYAIMQLSCAMITDYLYPILYDLYKKEWS